MLTNDINYNLFLKILDRYGPSGFTDIDPNDPLMIEAEEMMKKNDQFFYFGDAILTKILYTSKRSSDLIGIESDHLNVADFFLIAHPDETKRHLLGRITLLKIAHDLFKAQGGYKILSSNFRTRNAEGRYINMLVQFYIYYSTKPYKSVFALKVHTNINLFKKHKHGYHYYLGDDLSYFRYPDDELLMTGPVFSKREFEIIQWIDHGLSSKQVAGKLFLSANTVNTHRRNMIQKTGKANIHEVIYELKEQGIL